MRASVRTTPDLASAGISVLLVAVRSTGPGAAGTPRQILVLREGDVPQPQVRWSQLVTSAELSVFVTIWLGFVIDLFVTFDLSPWIISAVVVMVVWFHCYPFVRVIVIVR